jgi:hypothetical protein
MSISGSQVVAIATGAVIALLFAFLVVYVTWLFDSRIRAKESVPKSFFRWLRDLIDLAS